MSNGVKQGGIMSPILFNIFMETLSEDLCNSHVGCRHDSVCFKHLSYADDLLL